MCLSPVRCTISPDGGRPKPDKEGLTIIACGKCPECIKLRSMDWAMRAQHEASLHTKHCFLTLTYSEENLPSHLILKTKLKTFLDSLRKRIKPQKISYLVSHEYGTKNYRPHHHMIIFGYNPPEQKFLKYAPKSKMPLFTSPEISKLWKHGWHSIGTATPASAYYIASYALKGKTHTFPDPNGEIITVSDSMDCSKNPGIGYNYLLKNIKQLIASGIPLPRYYVKKMQEYEKLTLNKTIRLLARENGDQKLKEMQFLNSHLTHYENQMINHLKTRSTHEIYAKLIIDQQKISNSNSEFRSSQTDELLSVYLNKTRALYQLEKDSQ